MTGKDASLALCKVLRYAKKCMDEDAEPDIDKARELSGANRTLFAAIMKDAQDKGYVSGLYFPDYVSGEPPRVLANRWRITLDGMEHLEAGAPMKRAAEMMGPAALAAIDAAVSLAVKASLGMA